MPSFAYLDSVWDSSGKSGCVDKKGTRSRGDADLAIPEHGEKNFRGVYPPAFPDPKKRAKASESIAPEDKPMQRIPAKKYPYRGDHRGGPRKREEVVEESVEDAEDLDEAISVTIKNPKLVAMLEPYRPSRRGRIIEEILLESLENTSWTDILKNKGESFLGGLRGNKKKSQELLFYTWMAIAFVLFLILSAN